MKGPTFIGKCQFHHHLQTLVPSLPVGTYHRHRKFTKQLFHRRSGRRTTVDDWAGVRIEVTSRTSTEGHPCPNTVDDGCARLERAAFGALLMGGSDANNTNNTFKNTNILNTNNTDKTYTGVTRSEHVTSRRLRRRHVNWVRFHWPLSTGRDGGYKRLVSADHSSPLKGGTLPPVCSSVIIPDSSDYSVKGIICRPDNPVTKVCTQICIGRSS